jgi:uncharacterized protein (TIGR03067 family)
MIALSFIVVDWSGFMKLVRSALIMSAVFLSACATGPAAPPAPTPPPVPPARQIVSADPAMTGTWLPVKAELGGKDFRFVPDFKLEVRGDRFKTYGGTKTDIGRLVFYDGAPRGVDVIGEDGQTKGQILPAIYRFNGNEMEICYDLSGKERPRDFVSKPGTQTFRITYKPGR